MRHRRRLVLGIFIYLTLDLSLPAMPGAFVFEPADSAESIQARTRPATEAVASPALMRSPMAALFTPSLENDERPAPIAPAEQGARPLMTWQSRAQDDSAPNSEDPH